MFYRSISFIHLTFAAALGAFNAGAASKIVTDPGRELQVAFEVDVVVAGGSTGAVSAAVNAAKQGAKVFLLTDRPYVGEDMCASLDLALRDGEMPNGPLTKEIFGSGKVTTPLKVKRAMDRALLDAGVRFLTGCYPAEVVTNAKGEFAGITMVNRSGRQFVKAKVLIDATEHASLARQVVQFTKFKPGKFEFGFRVIGGELQEGKGLKGRTLGWKVRSGKKSYPVHEYVYVAELKHGTWREVCRVEQELRSLTDHPKMVDCSERMKYNLGTRLTNTEQLKDWPGAKAVDLKHFQDKENKRIYVLGKAAGLSREAAAKMARPIELVSIGRQIGELAAKTAAGMELVKGTSFPNTNHKSTSMVASEKSRVLKTSEEVKRLRLGNQSLPVLGEFDVVVVGGGTSGAPAAIGAGESGAKTLVIEYLDELGGVMTAGLIGKYWYGLRNGFTKRIDKAVSRGGSRWDVVEKSEWMRQQILKSDGEIWYRSFGCGAVVDGKQVRGVVVATPTGRGVVLAKTVIDSTGNADIAAHANAETRFSIGKKGQMSVQLAGYPYRNLGDSYNNTCYALVDDCDAIDIWQLMLYKRNQAGGGYDVAQLIDSRERRRIVGDYTLTTQDILTGRTFEDTVVQMKSNFDAAAFPSTPMLLVKDMKGPVYTCNMPYRCMLPKSLSGIIATGLGASSERDAMTLTRMQPDLQNQGYAMGIAAAMSALKDGKTRAIDVKKLQKRLIEVNILPKGSEQFKDSFPLPEAEIEAAVESIAAMSRKVDQSHKPKDFPTFRNLAIVMSHPKQSLPLLERALNKTANINEKVNYAKVLAALGSEAGRDVLVHEVTDKPWDKGVGLTSQRKSGNCYSDMDRLIIALGSCSGASAKSAIMGKLRQLKPEHNWSHYRAMAIALRNHRTKDAVEPLAKLLKSTGFSGRHRHYRTGKDIVTRKQADGRNTKNALNSALRELTTAGMLYSVGDQDGLGRKVLENYRNEIGGHLARYAEAFLRERK